MNPSLPILVPPLCYTIVKRVYRIVITLFMKFFINPWPEISEALPKQKLLSES